MNKKSLLQPIKNWNFLKISFLSFISVLVIGAGIWTIRRQQSYENRFVIAPWFNLNSFLLNDFKDPQLNSMELNTKLQKFKVYLDALEPGGANGDVQLGFTIRINLYDLYSKNKEDQWKFDSFRLKKYLDIVEQVGRPVVINLSVNHFIGGSEFSDWVFTDYNSLALTNRGLPVREEYFNNRMIVPTFSRNLGYRVNQVRFSGFKLAMEQLVEFDRKFPKLIHAVTIVGELHHFVPNLANPASAGIYGNAEMTDYSEGSKKDFIFFLKNKFLDISSLNQTAKTHFKSWSTVEPPHSSLNGSKKVMEKGLHLDQYSSGNLIVSGWADIPNDEKIQIFVDDELVFSDYLNADRLDVYEVRPEIKSSNVGFKAYVDVTLLSVGQHQIQVELLRNEKHFLLAERTFFICNIDANDPFKNCDRPSVHSEKFSLRKSRPRAEPPQADLRFSVDLPLGNELILVTPLSQMWSQFRTDQILNLMSVFEEIAIRSGLSKKKLFTHEILPNLEGSWNESIFSVPNWSRNPIRINRGYSIYGSKSKNLIFERTTENSNYGVPEFNPRASKNESVSYFEDTLRFHQINGARFVSPYYMDVDERMDNNLIGALLISPRNSNYRSDYFYNAIENYVSR